MGRRYPSPSGDRVAYQRKGGAKGRVTLWIARADGSDAQQVLDVARAVVVNPPRVAFPFTERGMFFDIDWSADEKAIYVLADAWGTSRALYAIDLKTKRVRFVNPASSFMVIRRCADPKQIGRLIVFEHSYYGDQHPVGDVYLLLDDRGSRYGEIGENDENVQRFYATVCGVGPAPPNPRNAVPEWLRAGGSHVCGDYVVRYQPRRFLDGTSLQLFRWTRRSATSKSTWILARLELSLDRIKHECPDRAK
ncbi:hypothetical protein JYT28_01300 [Desulfobulbus sp. AH-315-M07]|nr:hypothetical protein [Desulfobulbus sp. AH-315-M07]